MRDSRNRRKVKDISKGRKDIEGKVIMNHPDALNVLNQIGRGDHNFSHVMSLATNNLRLFTQKRKKIGDTYVEKEAYIQSRCKSRPTSTTCRPTKGRRILSLIGQTGVTCTKL